MSGVFQNIDPPPPSPPGECVPPSNVKTVKKKRSTNVPQTFRHLTENETKTSEFVLKSTPAFGAGEDTLSGWREGWGSIFWKTPDTALYSTCVLCG
jgi:hypothetical protein